MLNKTPFPHSVENITAEIDAALDLLKGVFLARESMSSKIKTPASLLEQCLDICAQQRSTQPDSIRTVHHFACTGGTLISKCIAAMPNTQLLSEVDPLSTSLNSLAQPQFAPTDMVKLLRQSTRGVDDKLIIKLFLSNLEIIYSEAVNTGQRLVLRDHAHSYFCKGDVIPIRPSLRDMVKSKFQVRSVVTVRHPIDSYLSLKSNEWIHFNPATFDEYCKRYIAFLRAYEDLPIICFENFIAAPLQIMQEICAILDLPFNEQFMDLFGVYKLTGDSGRSGDVIGSRPRREMRADMKEELFHTKNYEILNNLLQYD
ncbi:hypothetical protein [Methyloglobulus sp.]|uniref:hypothetical protein n=1 Tax=Methyloglobulus sp. TaxID=2518622 RepID=UPI0032B85FE1